MPAGDETRYDLKRLHRIFAASAVALLIATIWMLWEDHNRPWKPYQREFHRIERAMDRLRLEQVEREIEALERRRAGAESAGSEAASQTSRAIDAALQMQRRLEEASRRDRSTYFVLRHGWLPWFGKRWLELPFLDAFNSPRKIENLWFDGLTQDYHFRRVRRFDRCTTCHQGIQAAAPGTAAEPGWAGEQEIRFVLAPQAANESGGGRDDRSPFGLQLAAAGLWNPEEAVVVLVRLGSPAARARPAPASAAPERLRGEEIRRTLLQRPLAPGAADAGGRRRGEPARPGLLLADVVRAVNGVPVQDAAHATRLLREAAAAAAPVTLLVRRGLPQPYASHPRLDLFVGPQSPHPMERFGCTVCHEGQGSATAFAWASHSPNDVQQRRRWRRQYGWFDNQDWEAPMLPRRFAESACLKCHYEAEELAASKRFPDPPAPKLLQGDRLLQTYGCFGCHRISGFSSDGRRVGPDRRPEPNYFAIALNLESDPRFAQRPDWRRAAIRELAEHPERDAARRRVLDMLEHEAADPASPQAASSRAAAAALRSIEHPGTLARVGPSLRRVASKLDAATLYDWISDPRALRPSTRMPRFFGLWNHLEAPERRTAQKYEPIEIRGIVAYLLQYSQPWSGLDPAASEDPTAEQEGRDERAQGPERERAERVRRGRELFETCGCLACHTHQDFPDADAFRDPAVPTQGPDLSHLGDKLSPQRNPEARRWLARWIRTPAAYSARTRMPALTLASAPSRGVPEERSADADPVEDLVEYLLSSASSGGGTAESARRDLSPADPALTDELATVFLRDDGCDPQQARRYLSKGIPPEELSGLRAAEAELAAAGESESLSVRRKLVYIGRRSIALHGCFGCHDIPGFEAAKPIGPELTGWGRKDPSQLAFEQIVSYLKQPAGSESAPAPRERPSAYYLEQIEAGHRIGFAYQKLTEPRSYDYEKAAQKPYTQRLRMPQFALTVEQREAIVTFLLGLTADPPGSSYIHRPRASEAARIAGAEVLDKYNCGGCHLLTPERWRIAFPPDRFGPQTAGSPPFPFLAPPEDGRRLQASRQTDRRGYRTARLEGMPRLSGDGLPLVYDDLGDAVEDFPEETYDPNQLEFAFQLWSPAVIDGQSYRPGEGPLSISSGMIDRRRLSRGGDLTKYLLPRIVRRRREANPAAQGSEAWGWLPPCLSGQGRKTQPAWLHDYLLDPQPIRPAAVLQMPKFPLSDGEASALVDYFAAADGGERPYSYNPRRSPSHLEEADARYGRRLQQILNLPDAPRGRRLEDAMRIVTDNSYCVRCHIVADFQPEGDPLTHAPDLSQAGRRLQPRYVRQWIARPTAIRPYTAMPINIPYDPSDTEHQGGIDQALYHGSSVEQLDALVDLLANFDRYVQQRRPVAPLVKPRDQRRPGGEGEPSGGAGGREAR